MRPDPYATIVDLYDLEHADFAEDVEFFLQLAELGEGSILELGCGTGRVLLPLAEAGFAVAGVDASQPMLDVAAERARQRGLDVSLHLGDMANIGTVPGGPFCMIIASLNSIMHLVASEQRAMIESAFASMVPGGRLVIDTLNPSLGQLNHLLNVTHLEGSWRMDEGETIDKWGHRTPGDDPQVIDTLIWYDRMRKDGNVHRTRTRFNLRYVHQSELALLLELAGFTHVDWYGTYELDAWESESDRLIAVAHRDTV